MGAGLKFWEKVGSAQVIVYTTNFIRARFNSISGVRTNFTCARTTFSVGLSMGEILVWHG